MEKVVVLISLILGVGLGGMLGGEVRHVARLTLEA
jgi:hypothetical protein